MSNYQTITALLGKNQTVLQETVVAPLETLQSTANTMSAASPTASNQQAKQKLDGMAEMLRACLTPDNPMQLFKQG
ncbi:hypothetical protein [Legionella tunisiensis]|uniref:hypothetical protein n=1 Tax=Legionella tunisiensis TaxID=1034944 RepID=UPI0003051278|nr:hypothetical protein [Legionella tunisiensis]